MGFEEKGDLPVVTQEITPEQDAALAGDGNFNDTDDDPGAPVDDTAEPDDAGIPHETSLEDIAAAGQADPDAIPNNEEEEEEAP